MKIYKQKPEIINSHFSKQCTLINNTSKIPSECPWKSNEFLSSIIFEINDIGKIIKNLYPNRSCRHDMHSICMLKLCSESANKRLKLFKSCLETGQFPPEFPTNVVPVSRKGNKQL